MNWAATLVTLALMAGQAQAQTAVQTTAPAGPTADLLVRVTGVRNATGMVELCLWRTADSFPDCTASRSVERAHVPAAPGMVEATFSGLAPGVYAVSAFHDERGLHRVETNFLGIPRSGVGASRDPRARFGPPSFRDAAFALPAGRSTVAFQMRYPL